MKIYEQEIEEQELKEYLVLGILYETKEIKVLGIMGTFDTQPEAETYIGIESMQLESEGVEYHIYKKVVEKYIGRTLKGFCNGYFGRDSYGDKVIEAEGSDWVVIRENRIPKIAIFNDENNKIKMLNEWL